MPHLRSVALLIPTAAVLSGCGAISQDASQASSPATTVVHRPTKPPKSKLLVLPQSELGHSYAIVKTHTRPSTLAETIKGDPPRIKAIERRAFANGYEAEYVGPAGDAVLSAVSVFKTRQAVARILPAWQHTMTQQLTHGRRIAVPGVAPGDTSRLITGTATGNGRTFRMYFISWRRGPVIGFTGAFGPGVNAAWTATLARRQDARIALALAR